MHEVAQKISLSNRAGIRKAVRVIQDMVEEVMLQDKPVLLAASTLKVYDDYTFTHSVNVAILSMYLGKQIGLSKKSLESLGVCGLFHDLGKILVPPNILNKPGKLNDNEFSKIKWHPFNSVRLITKLRATRERKAKIIMAPFEHHLKYNLTGYPDLGWKKPLTLFGRILAIADVYDALTSARVYRPEGLSPDRALGLMLQGSGTDFDPIALKIFINMLGIYPVGTLLKLDTEEIGLVSDKPSTEALDRPRLIKLVWDERNGGFTKAEEIDLSDCDPKTGAFLRNIEESIHPAHYGIQPAQFLTS
ncbi:MAG: HD domain-containing protein [Proteobacteria bacterium]|nr:HD domain-containing protein [Pseudomonadota bacterium]MBU1716107.1 HD domain-containing protein [Pseudomonadota bacterium]